MGRARLSRGFLHVGHTLRKLEFQVCKAMEEKKYQLLRSEHILAEE